MRFTQHGVKWLAPLGVLAGLALCPGMARAVTVAPEVALAGGRHVVVDSGWPGSVSTTTEVLPLWGDTTGTIYDPQRQVPMWPSVGELDGRSVVVWAGAVHANGVPDDNDLYVAFDCFDESCVTKVATSQVGREETRPSVWNRYVAYETDTDGVEVADWRSGTVVWQSGNPSDRQPHLWDGRLVFLRDEVNESPGKCLNVPTTPAPMIHHITLEAMAAGESPRYLGQPLAAGEPAKCSGPGQCCDCDTAYADSVPYCDGCYQWKLPRVGGPAGRWVVYHGGDCGPSPWTPPSKLYLTDLEIGCTWRVFAQDTYSEAKGAPWGDEPADWDIFGNTIVWTEEDPQGIRNLHFLAFDPSQIQRTAEGYCPKGMYVEPGLDPVPMVPILQGSHWTRGDHGTAYTSSERYPTVWHGLNGTRASSNAVDADVPWFWGSGLAPYWEDFGLEFTELLNTDVHRDVMAMAFQSPVIGGKYLGVARFPQQPPLYAVGGADGVRLEEESVTNLSTDGDLVAYFWHPEGRPGFEPVIVVQDLGAGTRTEVVPADGERRSLTVTDGLLYWQQRDATTGAWVNVRGDGTFLEPLDQYMLPLGDDLTAAGESFAWSADLGLGVCAGGKAVEYVRNGTTYWFDGHHPDLDLDENGDPWLVLTSDLSQDNDGAPSVLIVPPWEESFAVPVTMPEEGCSYGRAKVSATADGALVAAERICGVDAVVVAVWTDPDGYPLWDPVELGPLVSVGGETDRGLFDVEGDTVIWWDGGPAVATVPMN